MSDRILIDTSVWISFFRNANSEVSLRLRNLLQTGNPVYTGIIATELYRGAKSAKETAVLDEMFSFLECLVTQEEHFSRAGQLGYTLAHHGQTIGTVDLVIAQIAISNNATLFTLDNHFTAIARYSDLRLY